VLCDECGYSCKLADYAVAEQVDSVPATSRKAGSSWLQMKTKVKHATENTSLVFKNKNKKKPILKILRCFRSWQTLAISVYWGCSLLTSKPKQHMPSLL